jgi:hypothetical protein
MQSPLSREISEIAKKDAISPVKFDKVNFNFTPTRNYDQINP